MATLPSQNRNWEDVFRSWGGSPSETQQTKCENAERAVRNAIQASQKLNTRDIEVLVQGSYANRTNVLQDSDVDICVLCREVFFTDYRLSQGLNDAVLGYEASRYLYSEFKNDLEAALISYFGAGHVSSGKKAFDVHANTYRVDADVVPCFEHRRPMGNSESNWIEYGTELRPENGGRIINWPRQNYENGVAKNNDTGRRFKAVVRILKCLRNEMAANGHEEAQSIPSYLIECLVWNVPNQFFGHYDYTADVRAAIAHLWNETLTDEACKEQREINDRMYLLRGGQAWTRDQVHNFLYAAWNYLGFR
jgi:hypothetical protein